VRLLQCLRHLPAICLAMLPSAFAQVQAASEPLKIYYIEKPPYYYSEDGQPRGFLLERSQAILQTAGIAYRLESRPNKRIQHELQQGDRAACSIGWFKTAERQAWAWFSAPIHRDAPMQVLTTAPLLQRVGGYADLTALLASDLRLGLTDGFSYGALDQALQAGKPLQIASTPMQLVHMLAAGRIDYTLIDAQELPFIPGMQDLHDAQLHKISLPGIPEGELRYLMCSRKVDKALLERVEAAIEELGITP
jgi:uncharacterized protein (TIGR02285 family)